MRQLLFDSSIVTQVEPMPYASHRNDDTYIQRALLRLVELMSESESSSCFLNRDIPFSLLWKLARYNKMTYVLRHYLSCPRCAPILSKKERTECLAKTGSGRHMHMLLREQEIKMFQAFAKQNHFRYVFFKDMKRFPALSSQKFYEIGSDIDVLVPPEDIGIIVAFYRQQHYTVVPIESQEFHLISPKTHVLIDVQKTIAAPHYSDVLPLDAAAIVRVNKLCFAGNTPYLSRELLLIILVIRFWSHELCRGLRLIQDIMEISFKYEDSLSWEYITTTLGTLGYLSRYQALLLIGQRFFGYRKLPSSLRQIPIPPLIYWITQRIDIQDISHLDNIRLWYSFHKKQAEQWMLVSRFLNYCCDMRYSPVRIIRPRFFPLLVRYIV